MEGRYTKVSLLLLLLLLLLSESLTKEHKVINNSYFYCLAKRFCPHILSVLLKSLEVSLHSDIYLPCSFALHNDSLGTGFLLLHTVRM